MDNWSIWKALIYKLNVPEEKLYAPSKLWIIPTELFTSDTTLHFTTRYFCPGNCSGRGKCHHGKVDGCQCFDSKDDSKACINSPIQQPDVMPAPNPTITPTITSSSYPSEIPSNSPTEKGSDIPSILAAIIGPTVYNISEEVEESSSLKIYHSCLSSLLRIMFMHFIF